MAPLSNPRGRWAVLLSVAALTTVGCASAERTPVDRRRVAEGVAVLARPGQNLSARRPKAAAIYAGRALGEREAPRLCTAEPPAWCFVNVPMVDISSTEIRARGDWRR